MCCSTYAVLKVNDAVPPSEAAQSTKERNKLQPIFNEIEAAILQGSSGALAAL